MNVCEKQGDVVDAIGAVSGQHDSEVEQNQYCISMDLGSD